MFPIKKIIFHSFGGLMGIALSICNVWWHQWQFYVALGVAIAWSQYAKWIGFSDGEASGVDKTARMQKYLDHMKSYYEEQLTKLGHKEKIL